MNLLILFGIRRNCLSSGRSRSLYLSIRWVTKQTVLIIQAYNFFVSYIQNLSNILLSRLTPYADKLFGIFSVGFDVTSQLVIILFCTRQTDVKKWQYSDAVNHLFVDFKKAYDSVRREVLYNLLIEFGIPTKRLSLIKMCRN